MDTRIDGLLTEEANPRTAGIDTLDTTEILGLINAEDQTVAVAVGRETTAIAAVADAVAAAFGRGGRLIYLGAGTSGRLGVLDAAECPPTFGVDPGQVIGLIAGGEPALTRAAEGVEDDPLAGIEQLEEIGLTAGDVVVGIAASGRTPYVVSGLRYARALGAFTAAVSCTPDSQVGEVAELAITLLVGPEVIAGSTRMKAGTATKMVLNMITTAAMVRCGKVYGNLMVDVRPTNAKLWERAQRMVMTAAGATREQAVATLEASGRRPKVAIVMLKGGCSAPEAEDRLAAAGGFIRAALNEEEKGNGR